MSVARITTVKSARKDQGECGKCGTPIPVGSPYLHYTVGFRSHFKRVRCAAVACIPRPSERESSSKAGPMSAIEDFAAQTFDTLDDLADGFQDVVDAFREYADECRDALDAWENGNSMLEERADGAEQAADELDGWEPESYDGDVDDDDNPTDADEYAEHVNAQKDAAEEALGDAESMWA